MGYLVEFIIKNSSYAPWLAFGSILLAGLNLPISVDLIVILSAFLAATMIPEHTFSLYISLLFGTYFSAWIAYWMGRKLGRKLLKIKWFSKILHRERLVKVAAFYEKHGFLTLFIGRFIPFGIRNCIFMTSGMSHSHFGKFALRDLIGCFTWVTLYYYAFYNLGLNYQTLLSHIKMVNLTIFSVFSVTVIGLFWYKKRKKKQTS